jgi:hypothetical protein
MALTYRSGTPPEQKLKPVLYFFERTLKEVETRF